MAFGLAKTAEVGGRAEVMSMPSTLRGNMSIKVKNIDICCRICRWGGNKGLLAESRGSKGQVAGGLGQLDCRAPSVLAMTPPLSLRGATRRGSPVEQGLAWLDWIATLNRLGLGVCSLPTCWGGLGWGTAALATAGAPACRRPCRVIERHNEEYLRRIRLV